MKNVGGGRRIPLHTTGKENKMIGFGVVAVLFLLSLFARFIIR